MKKSLFRKSCLIVMMIVLLASIFPFQAIAATQAPPTYIISPTQSIVADDFDVAQVLTENTLNYWVQDEWIYYIKETYRTDMYGDPARGQIYKVKKDGTERTLLVEDEVLRGFGVIGDTIYFLTGTETIESDGETYVMGTGGVGTAYSIDSDGTNVEQLPIPPAVSLITAQNYVFYVDEETWQIHRYDPSTGEDILFAEEMIDPYESQGILALNDEWLYVSGYNEDWTEQHQYVVNPEGTEQIWLESVGEALALIDNKLYYLAFEEFFGEDDSYEFKFTIRKADLDSLEDTSVADFPDCECNLYVQTTSDAFVFLDWEGNYTWISYNGEIIKTRVALTDIQNHWAKASIERLIDLRIINGNADRTFKPEDTITREQFVKMLVIARGYDISSNKAIFSDVPANRWSAPYVTAAIDAGIITQAQFGTAFSPEKPITREEMAVMIAKALKLKENVSAANKFKDVQGSNKGWIGAVAEIGIINGVTKDSFAGADTAKRAEAAVMVDRMLQYLE